MGLGELLVLHQCGCSSSSDLRDNGGAGDGCFLSRVGPLQNWLLQVQACASFLIYYLLLSNLIKDENLTLPPTFLAIRGVSFPSFEKDAFLSMEGWCKPVIPALGRWRQEDQFKSSLDLAGCNGIA